MFVVVSPSRVLIKFLVLLRDERDRARNLLSAISVPTYLCHRATPERKQKKNNVHDFLLTRYTEEKMRTYHCHNIHRMELNVTRLTDACARARIK